MSIGDVSPRIAALVPARLALWPLLGGAGALATAVRDGRRRVVLNERLHELRRPLQTLALLAPPAAGSGVGEGPVEMAAAALAALEREINGERQARTRAIVALRPLLEAARRRWCRRAASAGVALGLRWNAGEVAVVGDRVELAAALDNLIANALEHGGGRIELTADLLGDRVCLAVVDAGGGASRGGCRREPLAAGGGRETRGALDRLAGRSRHGHGLRLVRRTAARHGGSFALHRGEAGTTAVLELPPARRVAR